MRRRDVLGLPLGLFGAASGLPHVARAQLQSFPSKPVRWVLGFAAGGTTDIVSRIVTQWLSEQLGQPFIIDTRPGAGTNLGTESVIRSTPDGYTVLLAGTPNAINASLYPKLSFNFIRDTAPVVGIAAVPNVMVVHPSLPVKTVPEFLAYAKEHPGKVNMASSGVGSTPHLAGELFKMMTGVHVQHVPYRGAAQAVTDLLAGQVQLYFVTTPVSIEYIKAGRLRPLAATTVSRLPEFPDLPTVGESVPGYEASAWYGVAAPKDTPPTVVDKLNRDINAALADTKVRSRLVELGCTPLGGTPAAFGKLIADETEKWGKVVQFAGLKAE
ncbi:MAG: tripartite tricarboxylate transporter substrate binding protein [Xanthobacteraceae bacterium]|jgi:tripartite-type tricarboxylate transporter receptor subunit TctC